MKLLLILLCIYFGFKILARYVFPVLLKSMINKAQQNFDDQSGGFQQEKQRPEGEVTIQKKKPPKSRKESRDDDEYVDFEEVD